MPIPDYQTLMLPLLKHAAQGETRVPEVAAKIADELHLSAEEREQRLPSGRQEILNNRLHWAKFHMSKAGLIESSRRGWFRATEAGKILLERDPSRIDVNTLLEYPTFREFYQNEKLSEIEDSIKEPPTQPLTITPEEQIEGAYAALQSALREDLLQRTLQNSPTFFERLIVDLLVAMGYGGSHRSAAAQLGRSGDGGVDGIINEDRLGLDRVYVQAKRYATGHSVGRPDVQAFVGSLVGLGATKGVFVTTSSFT